MANLAIYSGSSNCTFHTLSPLRPLVFSGNEHLLFGPYNTFYATLDEHMRRSGLGTMLNQWDQPLVVGKPSVICLHIFA